MVNKRKKTIYLFTLIVTSITFYSIYTVMLFRIQIRRNRIIALKKFMPPKSTTKTDDKFLSDTIQAELIETSLSSKNYDLKEVENTRKAHHLENVCKYPILDPFDENLSQYLTNTLDNATCRKVLPDIVEFKDGILSVNQKAAKLELNSPVICQYRPIGGTLRNNMKRILPLGPWITVINRSTEIFDDQIQVRCFKENDENSIIYNFSFAHVPPRLNKTFAPNTEDLLSLNIILLDSTSRNGFRRHMPLTWDYLINGVKAFDLEGLMKVGDNTMVNVIPLLAGLRFINVSDEMPSDVPMGQPIDTDKFHMMWKEYQDKGCATMLNDDPVHPEFGLFYNPRPECIGFMSKPTDYWYRPWYLYNIMYPAANSSKLCFGNEYSFNYQLNLIEQMAMRYSNTCYFSFSLFGLSHDDTTNLELMDFNLKKLIKQMYDSNSLNKTILIVMGDHGQRIHIVTHAFIGQIEERMPLFTILFPQWFQQKYPNLMKNFRINKYRVTSHFDIYQTLKDFSDANFDGKQTNKKFPRRPKGVSLLHNVLSANRSCKEPSIPENHCTCLVPKHEPVTENMFTRLLTVIKDYTLNLLENYPECKMVDDIKIINISTWTNSQLLQHGIRYLAEIQARGGINRKIVGAVEYYEVEYLMLPMKITALIRLQHNRESQSLFVNVEPMIINGTLGCKWNLGVPSFCQCD